MVMDYKDVKLSLDGDNVYGTTSTAKYLITRPSNGVFMYNAIRKNMPASIGFFDGDNAIIVFTVKPFFPRKEGMHSRSVGVETKEVEKFSHRIANRNDIFRAKVFTGPCSYGKVLSTQGFNALAKSQQEKAYKLICDYDDFKVGDDPYKEHDFGYVIVDDQKIYWKIDYFADEKCEMGTVHTAESYLILTVMLKEDY